MNEQELAERFAHDVDNVLSKNGMLEPEQVPSEYRQALVFAERLALTDLSSNRPRLAMDELLRRFERRTQPDAPSHVAPTRRVPLESILRSRAAWVLVLLLLAAAAMLAALPTASAQINQLLGNAQVVWVLDRTFDVNPGMGDVPTLIGLNPQTGTEFLRIPDWYFEDQAAAPEGRWQYATQVVLRGEIARIAISKTDLVRGRVDRIVQLPQPLQAGGKSSQSNLPDASLQLAVSKDGRTLALLTTSKEGPAYSTNLTFFDSNLAEAPAQMLAVFAPHLPGEPRPYVQPLLADDHSRWILLQYLQAGSESGISTAVASIDLDQRRVLATKDVTDLLRAPSFSVNELLSPDGTMLYLLSPIVESGNLAGYRFAALTTDQLQLVHSNEALQSAGAELLWCPTQWPSVPVRITTDGDYMYSYCYRSETEPGAFKFLDTASGLVTDKVPLQFRAGVDADDSALQTLESPDGKLLYAIQPATKEIAVLDLQTHAITRGASLEKGANAALPKEPFNPTSPAISPDGRRLYFVGQSQDQPNHGIYAVETESLRLVGIWLGAAPDVSGLRVSPDGRELYALGSTTHALYVLDAATGRVLRSYDAPFKKPYYFANR